jgi:ubiquinone/menaquinone biosynthesis C-methylase UbiE
LNTFSDGGAVFHPNGPTFFELARQALSSTERGYDLLAPKFDYTPFRTADAVLAAVKDHIAALGPFDSALDVCTGTGAGLGLLRPLCACRAVGVDFSAGMLRVCAKKQQDAPGSARFELVMANVLRLPFESAFDVAVCFGALGHIRRADESRFVGEIARVLRPGGRFVFVTSYLPPFWSLPYWAARTFNAAMHVRNLLIAPAFVMYYLRFLLPDVTGLLSAAGFAVEIRELALAGELGRLKLVIAIRGGRS